ncbi:hypothetical protein [Agromyces seonyuensis]|uniref:4'-phosphopantetheinyl transferase superfamily protein n=1 Tax=Agromyces seonyuensis TaxID=2662446 RepID=A0A6I4P5J9_9MICO|nr:hypothetical protein [Agromyces seonyuensis]MWB98714.1 hypothetical protein [Agromyces seonyuensis]
MTGADGFALAIVPHGDAGRFDAGRAAAREALHRLTGRDAEEFRIEARCPDCGGPHGRPLVVGEPGLHVSITHADGRAVAVAARVPVGVDAEPVTTNVDRLAAAASLLDQSARELPPLEAWTAAEAVLKADGRGLRVDPSAVRFEDGGASIAPGQRRYRILRPDARPDGRPDGAGGLAIAVALAIAPVAG